MKKDEVKRIEAMFEQESRCVSSSSQTKLIVGDIDAWREKNNIDRDWKFGANDTYKGLIHRRITFGICGVAVREATVDELAWAKKEMLTPRKFSKAIQTKRYFEIPLR